MSQMVDFLAGSFTGNIPPVYLIFVQMNYLLFSGHDCYCFNRKFNHVNIKIVDF